MLACLGLQSTGGRRRLVQVPGVHELTHNHLKDTHFRGGCIFLRITDSVLQVIRQPYLAAVHPNRRPCSEVSSVCTSRIFLEWDIY